MFGKKNKAVDLPDNVIQKSNNHFDKAVDWEVSRIQRIEKSESRAWKVVWIEAGAIACLSIAIALMLPLKETQPYVIKVDKSTGMTDILSIASAKDIPVDEMQDKYWLGQYVRSRESYDYRTVENDFIKTREMSTTNVFEPYSKLFEGKQSLDKTLGDNKRVVIELQNIVPNGNGIATVRFIKRVIDNANGLEESKTLWTATLGYEYQPTFKAEEANRIVNPFGFKVTTYRVDAEISNEFIPTSANDANATTTTPSVSPVPGSVPNVQASPQPTPVPPVVTPAPNVPSKGAQ